MSKVVKKYTLDSLSKVLVIRGNRQRSLIVIALSSL